MLVSVGLGDRCEFSITDRDSKQSQDLLELLWRHLEVIVPVLVLEETLCIESLSLNQGLEFILNLFHVLFISRCGPSGSVEGLSSSIVEDNINRLLQVLFREHFIYAVAELLPLDKFSFFWSLEPLAELLELSS